MPLSGKRRKAAFTIMCRQLFCFQLKKSTLHLQSAFIDVSVDLFSRAAARQGSFASAAGGRYSEQKELSSGLNFGV